MNIINAYAPHMGRSIEETDRFYADLATTHNKLPRRDLTFVLGDFNAKLGQPHDGEHFVSNWARGYRNRNGHLLAAFCELHGLTATNTFFRKRAKNLTTWTQRRVGHCIYNQIDYVLSPASILKLCTNAHAWSGTLTSSDHKLVTADFNLRDVPRRRFQTHVARDEETRLARSRLYYDEDARTDYQRRLAAALQDDAETLNTASPQDRWDRILRHAYTSAEDSVGYQPATSKGRFADPQLKTLSYLQQQLRLEIYNNTSADVRQLRKTRNEILHAIRTRCLELANQALDHQAEVIESLSTSSRVYEATRALFRKPSPRQHIRDKQGKLVLSTNRANHLVREHFRSLFVDSSREVIHPDSERRPLQLPIDPAELERAFRRLKNGRAAGPDAVSAELLKYGADALAQPLAELINQGFATGQHIRLGAGLLIGLPKPNKPRGECSSLRPIVLLNCVRKALSVVVLRRIAGNVAGYLSPHQSGFRPGRSTADAVWAHRWIAARVQRYREVYHILGIDLSRAFDTIDRAKLMDVLRSFLDDDEVRLIQLLLADTTLSLRSGSTTLNPFTSNLGTPQGDSLSPVLFIVYLEAALRDLADSLDVGRAFLDDMIVYADDADFVCRTVEATAFIQDQAPAILARWSLAMNPSKTELTTVARASTSTPTRHVRAQEEAWRNTKKLGSLLGDAEDVSRRKQLARAALNRMWTLWLRTSQTSERTRVRLYNSYVLPILLYNCGTWALTKGTCSALRAFIADNFARYSASGTLGGSPTQRSTSAVTLDLCATASPRHDGYSLDRFFAARIATQRSCKWLATSTALLKVAGEDAPARRYQRSWIKTFAIPSEDAGSAPKLTFSCFVPKHKTRPSGRNSWET
ncbi:putative EndonucleaseReverse transcriptase [Phytophthora cinnamomi]|uniref:putative EndonucleaseReverse transcriptase n=1 Tax=Phytophthora cinnamomi TaxID=4785 RepID=UPI00355A2FB6|nr:putative EndonucleaseReverse transcriptase [Phytophthora cinnamomi]